MSQSLNIFTKYKTVSVLLLLIIFMYSFIGVYRQIYLPSTINTYVFSNADGKPVTSNWGYLYEGFEDATNVSGDMPPCRSPECRISNSTTDSSSEFNTVTSQVPYQCPGLVPHLTNPNETAPYNLVSLPKDSTLYTGTGTQGVLDASNVDTTPATTQDYRLDASGNIDQTIPTTQATQNNINQSDNSKNTTETNTLGDISANDVVVGSDVNSNNTTNTNNSNVTNNTTTMNISDMGKDVGGNTNGYYKSTWWSGDDEKAGLVNPSLWFNDPNAKEDRTQFNNDMKQAIRDPTETMGKSTSVSGDRKPSAAEQKQLNENVSSLWFNQPTENIGMGEVKKEDNNSNTGDMYSVQQELLKLRLLLQQGQNSQGNCKTAIDYKTLPDGMALPKSIP